MATDPWERLEPDVRDALDAYIERRQRRFLVGGVSTVITIVVAIGGFLAFAFKTVQDQVEFVATFEANETVREFLKEDSTKQIIGNQQKLLSNLTQQAVSEAARAQTLSQKASGELERFLKNWEKKRLDIRQATDEIQQAQGIAKVLNEHEDNFRTVGDIRKQIEEVVLRSEFRKTLELPEGAVIAIDSAQGCPSGWAPFVEGAGRAIIGVGKGLDLTERKYRVTGGEEEHSLTLDEMPAHTHGIDFKDKQFVDSGTPRSRAINEILEGDTASNGNAKPHNNMPPYIALYFCRRE